jgi:methylenetetrahydrofolate dehydrogenase (NADP+)/methenyltetrahydrofolate cyclohydrolase
MIISGKEIQERRAKALARKVAKLGHKPVLVIVQIGDNKESEVYVRQKIKFGKSIGCGVEHYQLDKGVTLEFVRKLIGDFNRDDDIRGIIVQLPLPKALRKYQFEIIETIDPAKDVDGLTSANLKKLLSGEKGMVPATAAGVLTLLKESKVAVAGRHAVIVGRSVLVGRSLAQLLLNADATVTVCHSKTKDLAKLTKQADILVSAAGKPGLITAAHVSKGQTVIDVGTTLVDGKLTGDVDLAKVSKKVAYITPVPGGVGPMTVLGLFENLVANADPDTVGHVHEGHYSH